MDAEKWPLTSRVVEESERANDGDYDLTDESEPDLGNSLLRELAAEGLIEQRGPGCYYVSKLRPDRDKLS